MLLNKTPLARNALQAGSHAGLSLPERRILRSFWIVTHKDTHNLARVRAGKDWLAEVAQHGRERLLPPA